MCPICEDVPSFWILYPTMALNGIEGWYWLFSKAYLKKYTKYSELSCKEGLYRRKPTLDDIVCIVCSNDNNHEFVVEHSLFQKVMRHARRLET